MLRTGRTGFYFSVAVEGEVGAGDGIEPVSRSEEDLTVADVVKLFTAAKIPMERVPRTRTLSETRGFMKALIEKGGDRILGFTAFGAEAGEVVAVVQVASAAGLPYTALRDMVLTHPTVAEG